MDKTKYAWETGEVLKGIGVVEQNILNIGTVLAVARENVSMFPKIVQSQNVVREVLTLIQSLDIERKFKHFMSEEFEMLFSSIPTNALVKILMNTEQFLKEFLVSELFEEVIKHLGMGSRDLLTTPNSISEIANHYLIEGTLSKTTFHDGTAGYGSTAIMFAKKAENVHLALQERNILAATVLSLRLFLQETKADVAVDDIIQNPVYVVGGKLEQFDRVFMAPPFGLRLTEEQQMDMKHDPFNRFIYGIPPRSQGDLTFLSCGLSATKVDGKAAFLLPAGVLFRGGPEKEIRQRLIDFDVIESVVALPSLLQPYTGMKTVLLLCNKNKPSNRKGKILMVNAESFSINNKREITIPKEKIVQINDIISSGKEVEEVSRFVHNEEIQLGQLTPEKYIYKAETQVSEFGTISIDMDELNRVPTKALSELVDFYRGYNASTKDEDENGEYAVLKISDIQDGEVHLDKLTRYSIMNNAKIDNNRIQQGDVLLSVRGINRKVALFTSDREDVLMSQNFAGMRCGQSLHSRFLQLYLESPIAQFYFDKHTSGTTVMTLSMKDLKDLPVPVLPLEDQLKIVDAFEAEQRKITEELALLTKRQKELKLEVYAAMGIDKALIIQ
ncbi:N-6 DNA methylase [Lysinibacillus xylanilyticus]|uniref:N-6 DNA methylase n=1 Tax=Lysinibacillus xylanilyticus TaxID=582475 RepID=UPI0036DF4628